MDLDGFSGVKWSAASQIGRQLAQLLSATVLARLLDPTDFGLLAMAFVVTGLVGLFKDLGTAAAVVQKKDLGDTLLSSIFWLNVLLGVGATIMLVVGAPLAGLVYNEPGVVIVLRILAAGFAVSGAGTVHQALLERQLEFRSLARLELASVLVGAAGGIAAALLGAGVWSLVLQSLLTAVMSTALLWLANRWRPSRILAWSEVLGVTRFSLNLTGYNVFGYFARNADYFLIGRFLGSQQLGVYYLAYRLLLLPVGSIGAVVGRVMYPVLSKIQDDNERIAEVYLRMVALISFLSFPLMVALMVAAAPLAPLVLGAAWVSIIPLIQIFAPVGMLQSIGTTVGSIYQAKGRTDQMFRWGVGAGLLTIVAFLIGLRGGAKGVAVAYGLVTVVLFYPSFAIPFRLIGLPFRRLMAAINTTALGALAMLLGMTALLGLLRQRTGSILAVAFSLAAGLMLFILVVWRGNPQLFRQAGAICGLVRRSGDA
ncbi:MAG TPA: MOP flippase family protein [Anaerolineales bacterium]